MHRHLIAVALCLTINSPALAGSAGSESPQQSVKPTEAKATSILASAAAVPVPAAIKDDPAVAPKKVRAARVTTCRCGAASPTSER